MTKSGAKGKSKINFNTSLGFTEVVKTMTSLNTAQYKDLMDEIGAATIPDGLTDQTNWFDETYGEEPRRITSFPLRCFRQSKLFSFRRIY